MKNFPIFTFSLDYDKPDFDIFTTPQLIPGYD